MRLEWLSLRGFRSYVSLDWSPEPGVNVLVGPNGAGKTNLMEAIAYLPAMRSFRGAPDEALIAFDSELAVVRASLRDRERERLIELEISRSARRRAQVDKNRLRRLADLIGVVRVVAFLPDDLDLIKGGPGHRRDFLDQVAVQLWPATHVEQGEFERALRQRNAFLKSGDRDEVTLGVWDARLALSGGKVVARRLRVIEQLSPRLETACREVAGSAETVEMRYTASWSSGDLGRGGAGEYAEAMSAAFARVRRVDMDRGVTTVGPHRDEPVLWLSGHDARAHGSQGEQRTLAIALRLASHRAIAETAGEEPVLLLDDVFSELDPGRGRALVNALPSQAQTFVTTARPEDVPLSGTMWKVGDGTLA